MSKSDTRIQKKNQAAILDAGLKVFSQYGFRGATLDQVAQEAGLSKPNLLYYFKSKEAIYTALLSKLLENWLEPLQQLNPDGDPVEEILAYAMRKLDMSQHYPRESRLFANEIIQGAPRIGDVLAGELRDLVDETAKVIDGWAAAGRIKSVDPGILSFRSGRRPNIMLILMFRSAPFWGPRIRSRARKSTLKPCCVGC